MSERDWAAFERKLSAGKLIEQAAEECGVPVDEAVIWLAENRGRKDDEQALRLLSAEALHHGISTLIELSKIREGRVGTETEANDDDGITRTTKFDHPDGPAARALVNAGLKLRQMIKPAEPKANAARDLFDMVTEAANNWVFPERK